MRRSALALLLGCLLLVAGVSASSCDFTYSANATKFAYVPFQGACDLEDITAWSWNFGDGNTATEQNPTHRYLQPDADDINIYTVNLTVSNATESVSVEKAIGIHNLVPQTLLDTMDTPTSIPTYGAAVMAAVCIAAVVHW